MLVTGVVVEVPVEVVTEVVVEIPSPINFVFILGKPPRSPRSALFAPQGAQYQRDPHS